MVSIPVSVDDNVEQAHQGDGSGQFIRVIVADTQAIFRAGLRKIFALEDDIRVVGQAETLSQTVSASKKFSADIMIFEAALSPNPVEAVSDLLRHAPAVRLVVRHPGPDEELTLELVRRGAYAVLSREVEPEILVDCLRKVSQGEPWLEHRGVQWVLAAFARRGTALRRAPESAVNPQGNADRLLRDPGNEEQRNCGARRNDGTSSKELSSQGIRQTRCGRSSGTGAVLFEQPNRSRWPTESTCTRCQHLRQHPDHGGIAGAGNGSAGTWKRWA